MRVRGVPAARLAVRRAGGGWGPSQVATLFRLLFLLLFPRLLPLLILRQTGAVRIGWGWRCAARRRECARRRSSLSHGERILRFAPFWPWVGVVCARVLDFSLRAWCSARGSTPTCAFGTVA